MSLLWKDVSRRINFIFYSHSQIYCTTLLTVFIQIVFFFFGCTVSGGRYILFLGGLVLSSFSLIEFLWYMLRGGWGLRLPSLFCGGGSFLFSSPRSKSVSLSVVVDV